jgi:telomere length regulation protein
MSLVEDEAKDIVQVLTTQPSQEALETVLTHFEPVAHIPSSSAASVIFALVNTTVPQLWRALPLSTRQEIVRCLASVAGVNAFLMRADQLHAQIRHTPSQNEKTQLEDVVQVLGLILENGRFGTVKVFESARTSGMQGKLVMSEYIALVAGSKILNLVSRVSMELEEKSWIANGREYSKWLGRQCADAITALPDLPEVSTLLGKALSIGYPSSRPVVRGS